MCRSSVCANWSMVERLHRYDEDRATMLAGVAHDLRADSLRPFSRLDSSRSGKGHCGLGLMIATKIVEEHHGRLRLGNPVGGGFVAEIRFPRQA